jgi:hypothetical protein
MGRNNADFHEGKDPTWTSVYDAKHMGYITNEEAMDLAPGMYKGVEHLIKPESQVIIDREHKRAGLSDE